MLDGATESGRPLRASGRNLHAMLGAGTVLLGRYAIERVLGQGGMGAVYLARDTNLGQKPVAVKEMMLSNANASERDQAVQRFQKEAEILATLDHPNLVPVSHYFEERGSQFLVMTYIDGRTLQEIADASSGPLPVPQIMGWLEVLCGVLDYLHSRQPPVLFRDLKPSNIMLDNRGQIRLIDFGIARVLDGNKTTTFIKGTGTPGYSPVEQYGKGMTDARSDIYALGATLYFLLTRHVPPPSVDLMSGDEELQPPSRLNSAVPLTLDAVLMKMMAWRKQDRYTDIAELRKALSVASGAVAYTSRMAGTASPHAGGAPMPTTVLSRNAPHGGAAQPGSPGLAGPGHAPGSAVTPGGGGPPSTGSKKRSSGRLRSRGTSVAPPPAPSTPYVIPTHKLKNVPAHHARLTMRGHTGVVNAVACSSLGHIASAGADGAVRLWHPGTGKELKLLHEGDASIFDLRFGPNGHFLAYGDSDGVVYLRAVGSDEKLLRLEGHSEAVRSVDFAPNGRLLASGSNDGSIILWSGGSRGDTLKRHKTPVLCVRFSRDGTLLASASSDGRIILWRMPLGIELGAFQLHHQPVWSMAFTADERRLISVSEDRMLRLWDIRSHRDLGHIPHWAPFMSVAASSDNRFLATGAGDPMICLWHPSTQKLERYLEGHHSRVNSVAFTSDNRELVSGSDDGTVRVWSL
jgi:serine/threonine protein kinase